MRKLIDVWRPQWELIKANRLKEILAELERLGVPAIACQPIGRRAPSNSNTPGPKDAPTQPQ